MGGRVSKQFLLLGGVPLFIHAVRALLSARQVEAVVLVTPADQVDVARELLATHKITGVIGPVPGGETRQESVRLGLAHIPAGIDVVAVHDAARPFPDPDRLDKAIGMAAQGVGVVIGSPCNDTIKRVDGQMDHGEAQPPRVTGTPERGTLWRAFTPQVFPFKMIADAYDTAHAEGISGTDDASLVEHAGGQINMLAGERESLKVTTPDDLVIARAWLEEKQA